MWYIVTAVLIFLAMVCGFFLGLGSDSYIEEINLSDHHG